MLSTTLLIASSSASVKTNAHGGLEHSGNVTALKFLLLPPVYPLTHSQPPTHFSCVCVNLQIDVNES